MDKAMMLLIQRSSRKNTDGVCAGTSRVGASGAGHSVSIELLDDQGNKVVEAPEKVVTDADLGDLNPRKRERCEVDDVHLGGGDFAEPALGGSGVNKTITLVNSRVLMSNTGEPRSKKELVRVEIQPNERWTGGTTVSLRAFNHFHLPQDAIAFDGRRQDDLADRCKSRAGRFLADFMHIVEEFRADGNDVAYKRLEAEVSALRVERKKLMMSYSELEKRSTELVTANTALTKKVGEMEVSGQSRDANVSELERKLQEAETERDDLRSKCEGWERHIDGMNASYKLIVDENVVLKAEVQKGIEDIANALGDGYGHCVARMQGAGVDTTGHSFEDYIADLAALQPDDPTDKN
ncbi:uncharacterized protein LOC141705736 [Apium graveolens]|uniref:uncharacterized protein LOC141705736 n=1 Tax=Apium graveolens TaxID=4045 RepID=UPI003D7BEA3E